MSGPDGHLHADGRGLAASETSDPVPTPDRAAGDWSLVVQLKTLRNDAIGIHNGTLTCRARTNQSPIRRKIFAPFASDRPG